MQETYELKDLLVGELVTVMNGWMGAPHTSVEGPFIFVQKESGKYAEIFTEEEYGMNAPSNSTIQELYKLSSNNEENKFGKTYVRPTSDLITQYLTEEERQQFTNGQANFSINKKRILEIYNVIREQQSIKKMENASQEKELEKQYILNHKKGQ